MKINKSNDFIKGWYINKSICDELINFFENSKTLHKQGSVSGGILEDVKKSTDLIIKLEEIKQNKLYKSYLDSLMSIVKKYIKMFPDLNSNLDKWGITENIQLQRYYPSEGFYKFHCERSSFSAVKRLLVFMTYLNDVKKGGETEWFHQKLKIKPKKGLTVIWPADWMYLHRGLVSKKETKYIITGWFSFIDESNKI
jgi:prolyl 4-hydroxylase